MKRLAAMHDCPLLIARAFTATSVARATSALGITMNGSLPPSSSTDGLRWRPAVAPTSLPAFSLPVSVAAATRGSARICATRFEPTSSVWKTPAGAPARVNSSSIASAHAGTLDACFSSPTLPATSAGAAKRITCQNGKFHGITASTTPSGSNEMKPSVGRPSSPSTGSSRRKSAAWAA
jgi:hypothetical protein